MIQINRFNLKLFNRLNVIQFQRKNLSTKDQQQKAIRTIDDHEHERNDDKSMIDHQPTNNDNINEQNNVNNEKFDVSLIPKNARDNFVIQFNKQIPTYDQLFEYNIDKKFYNINRIISESRFLKVDFLAKLTKKYDLSLDELKFAWRNKIDKIEVKRQTYSARRHGILGPDLAAANFILTRGGRVRFKHEPSRWFTKLKEIPQTFDRKYRLISIDASDLSLIFEGLDNLILLNELEELNLSNNRLDDWCCDKLARLFRNSQKLVYLNLSKNKYVTHRGIETLYKIKSLKTLVIKETNASKYPFIELVILLFNDINPDCEIIYK